MGNGPLKIDPAIERFNTMRETVYLRSQWTPRMVRTAVLGFVVFPAAVYYLADKYYMHWDFSGSRKRAAVARTT